MWLSGSERDGGGKRSKEGSKRVAGRGHIYTNTNTHKKSYRIYSICVCIYEYIHRVLKYCAQHWCVLKRNRCAQHT
jgi:hypothetical protein